MSAAQVGDDQSQGWSYNLPHSTLDCYLKHSIEKDLN